MTNKEYDWKVLEFDVVSNKLIKARLKPFFSEPTFGKILKNIKQYAVGIDNNWWLFKRDDLGGVMALDEFIYEKILDDTQREVADMVMTEVNNN